jgi:hypothetical protein
MVFPFPRRKLVLWQQKLANITLQISISRGCCPPRNPTPAEGFQAKGHTQTLNHDDRIITCKEYKPSRHKRPNKQNRKTRREKLSHLGADNGTEPGFDKPQPKIVRPIYVTPIQKNPDAQVDLPRTMMEQSEEWRNHSDRKSGYVISGTRLYIPIQVQWAMENRRACLVCLCKEGRYEESW